ncbi:hypothetical protein C9374_013963 [Naegleria lovaniensis]|uniref:Uncharacterized protein n=1 Tax=Naegleria lovaniensis TaxID=51637 RepID=A0AA88GZR9_NAELO|nr:uncharacterized protein C9374_013963 [Naegleria lovaniensis]KAG2389403.1 hypothetical protein C9374_013963 [Naegleria lovaniensis]
MKALSVCFLSCFVIVLHLYWKSCTIHAADFSTIISDLQDSILQYNIAPTLTFTTVESTQNLTSSSVVENTRLQFARGVAKLSMFLEHKMRCNCRMHKTIFEQKQCIDNYSHYDIFLTKVKCETCLGAASYLKALRSLDENKTCVAAMNSVCYPFRDNLSSVGVACRQFSSKFCGIPMIESIVDVSSTPTDVCVGQSFCK